jgi:hypothetical protein
MIKAVRKPIARRRMFSLEVMTRFLVLKRNDNFFLDDPFNEAQNETF